MKPQLKLEQKQKPKTVEIEEIRETIVNIGRIRNLAD